MESGNCKLPLSSVRKFMRSRTRRSTDKAIEDEKVSTDELQEKIAEFEDYVQSTDIAAMQSTSFGMQSSSSDLLSFFDRTLKRDHGDVFQ